MLAPVSLHVPLCPAFRGRVASVYPWEVSDDAGRMWTMRETDGHIGRETFENAGFPVVLAGSKRVQVKGGMLLLAAYPWKTPTGKAVREIWFEYFWKRRSKEWCWIFESGRILEEMRESL